MSEALVREEDTVDESLTCDECGELPEGRRRVRCVRCRKLLCPHCFHHGFHTRTRANESTK